MCSRNLPPAESLQGDEDNHIFVLEATLGHVNLIYSSCHSPVQGRQVDENSCSARRTRWGLLLTLESFCHLSGPNHCARSSPENWGLVSRLAANFHSQSQAKKAIRGPAGTRAQAVAQQAQEQWQESTKKRKSCWEPSFPQDCKAFRSAVLADQRFAKNKFFPEAPRRARARGKDLEIVVPNNSDLPAGSFSPTSIGLQKWREEGSWPASRPLSSRSSRPANKPTIAARTLRFGAATRFP